MEIQKEPSQEDKKEKNSSPIEGEEIWGYFLPTNPLVIALIGVFAALTCIFTMLISIPVPATGGYINLGEVGVMISGLLFGPVVGAFAGGIGSGLADIFLGYTSFAPATLIIKGLEGFIVGLLADPKRTHERINYRDIVGVVIGGLIMVCGYFSYEFLLGGFGAALSEVLGNFFQFGSGIVISLLITIPIRKNLINAFPQVYDQIFIEENR